MYLNLFKKKTIWKLFKKNERNNFLINKISKGNAIMTHFER